MYNLNVDLAETAANAVNNLLSIDNAGTTPRTPEILNSLIAMTNPLDSFAFGASKTAARAPTSFSNDSSSSSSSSHMESPTTTPPSIQHTCSQLIKAGLKLSIEQKRKHNSESDDLMDLDNCRKRVKKSESESDERKIDGLTHEDEERRRRRRERNKIAATKCRLKKREKTINLIQESQTLDDQNIELKKHVQELQNQRHQLIEMLSLHRPNCKNNIPSNTRDVLSHLPPLFTFSNSVIELPHSYSRPASAESCYKTQDEYSRPTNAVISGAATYNRSIFRYSSKTPNIIVEEIDCFEPQFTDLDDPDSLTYSYDNESCHNYTDSGQIYSTTGMDNGCMA